MNINDIKDKNYLYFKDNFESITVGHLDQYVVIYDCKVYGYYLSMEEAIKIMQNNDISIGSFIVQKCTDNINTPYAVYYSTYVNDYTLINLFGK